MLHSFDRIRTGTHKDPLTQAALTAEHWTHDRMAGSDFDDSGFGDELAMTSTQTACTGSAGAGAPAALVAVGGQKTKRTGANGMVQVRAARMLVVHMYDLSTDVG